MAWAELSGTPLLLIQAVFHYVRADRTVAPVDLLDPAGLAVLVEQVPPAG